MLLFEITADQVVISIITTIGLREMMIWTLPDSIAGPDGWLVRTERES